MYVKVMKTHGFHPTEEELQDMIRNVDTNANGAIDFNEFIEMMVKRDSRNEILKNRTGTYVTNSMFTEHFFFADSFNIYFLVTRFFFQHFYFHMNGLGSGGVKIF